MRRLVPLKAGFPHPYRRFGGRRDGRPAQRTCSLYQEQRHPCRFLPRIDTCVRPAPNAAIVGACEIAFQNKPRLALLRFAVAVDFAFDLRAEMAQTTPNATIGAGRVEVSIWWESRQGSRL